VLSITDRLKLTAGARWSRDEKDYAVELIRIAGSVPPSTGKQQTEEWTPTVSLAYQATRDFLAYATFSRGYRQGGFAARFLGGLPNPLPSFGPEFVNSYEVGVKSAWLGRRLVVNLAAFRADYSDIQVNATTPTLPGFTLNLAKAELTGFEAEASADIGAGFTFEGSVGYVHRELVEVAPNTTTFAGTNVVTAITTASKLPGPDWQARVAISRDMTLAGGRCARGSSTSTRARTISTSPTTPRPAAGASTRWTPASPSPPAANAGPYWWAHTTSSTSARSATSRSASRAPSAARSCAAGKSMHSSPTGSDADVALSRREVLGALAGAATAAASPVRASARRTSCSFWPMTSAMPTSAAMAGATIGRPTSIGSPPKASC